MLSKQTKLEGRVDMYGYCQLSRHYVMRCLQVQHGMVGSTHSTYIHVHIFMFRDFGKTI